MNEAKHTPGLTESWKTEPVRTPDGKICAARLYGKNGSILTIENTNAKRERLLNVEFKQCLSLIAAAPDLLEACKAAEKLFTATLAHPEANDRHPIHVIRAAIAKAEGK